MLMLNPYLVWISSRMCFSCVHAANDSHNSDQFVAQIFHEDLAPVCDIFEVEQTPFTSYEEELPNQHFKSAFLVDMDLHSLEIVEQQEIYKSENDLLEQEREKTSHVQDILSHFKQPNEKYQECFVALNGCETYDLNELFQGEHEEYNLINNADVIQQQLCLLNQLEAFHEFQDRITNWMDSYFSKIPKVVSFSMIII